MYNGVAKLANIRFVYNAKRYYNYLNDVTKRLQHSVFGKVNCADG